MAGGGSRPYYILGSLLGEEEVNQLCWIPCFPGQGSPWIHDVLHKQPLRKTQFTDE
jgi:hypothetical protein